MQKIGLTALFVLLLIGVGCNGDPEDHLAKAWSLFEEGDLSGARDHFDSALSGQTENAAEAYMGLGWCDLLEDKLTDAYNNFSSSMTYENLLDANAGAAIASSELSRYTDAIDYVNTVLNANPDYFFTHYTSVDSELLRLTKAKSAAALGDFETALDEIQEIEPSFDANPDTPQGQADILTKIEELISG
ncbi:hypothetical protein GF359_09235 [candidate division WOR-3 bacterium]|uniref:Tetratricopeptide repeat protein n=1 Tax=candidate division WOR-3 bacterium TaxID=2052148 RepID=A0A9D5QDS7_UNCW3|nr:hypothetical protein [candidate division WOR-3 bacterium]MBD3365382.1 hypothetical protein [candidate division WOR-3 bacterium]